MGASVLSCCPRRVSICRQCKETETDKGRERETARSWSPCIYSMATGIVTASKLGLCTTHICTVPTQTPTHTPNSINAYIMYSGSCRLRQQIVVVRRTLRRAIICRSSCHARLFRSPPGERWTRHDFCARHTHTVDEPHTYAHPTPCDLFGCVSVAPTQSAIMSLHTHTLGVEAGGGANRSEWPMRSALCECVAWVSRKVFVASSPQSSSPPHNDRLCVASVAARSAYIKKCVFGFGLSADREQSAKGVILRPASPLHHQSRSGSVSLSSSPFASVALRVGVARVNLVVVRFVAWKEKRFLIKWISI